MAERSELMDWKSYVSRRAIVLEGILAVADADDANRKEWHRAWCRFWAAIRAAGWRPERRGKRRSRLVAG